jgi:hypothetical protein
LTKKRLAAYLDEVADTGLVTISAKALDIHPHTIWERRQADPDFELCVQMALEDYTDKLRREVHRRGVEGWIERGIYDKDGNHLGDVKKFSDRLLELHVKKHDPTYRENLKVEANVEATATHTHTAVPMGDLRKLDKAGRDALRTVLKQLGAGPDGS